MLPSGREALRIAAALSLPLAEFIRFRAREQREGDFRIVLWDKDAQRRRYHRMELRRIATPEQSSAQRCYFLLTQEGAVRCACYADRPRACIAYPYQQSGDSVVLSRLSRGWCPKGAWDGLSIDVPAHHLLRREQEADRQSYHAIIDTWNECHAVGATQAGSADFLAYLERAYK